MRLPKEALSGPRESGYKKGLKLPAEYYMPFVPTRQAVAADWKDAERFAALPVHYAKDTGYGVLGPPLEEICTIDADQIQLVILDADDLKWYFKEKEFGDHFRITVDSTIRATWNADDEVETTEWPLK